MLEVAYYILSCSLATTWCVLAVYISHKKYPSGLKAEVLQFTQVLYQAAFVALVGYVISVGILISEWYESLMAKNIPLIIVVCSFLCGLIFHVVTLVRVRRGTLTAAPIYIHAGVVTVLLIFSLYQFEKTALIFSLTAISIFAIWPIIRYGIHKYIKHFL